MALDTWAFEHRVTHDFSRPVKPTDNGHIASSNARWRNKCLNVHQFHSLAHAKAVIEAWRVDYSEHRPHGSLGDLTPAEYATIHQEATLSAAA